MSGRINSPSDVDPEAKMTEAMGRPVAKDFLDPQNWIAMISARENPSFLEINRVSHNIKMTKAAAKTTRNTISQTEMEDQIPSTTPLEKAE